MTHIVKLLHPSGSSTIWCFAFACLIGLFSTLLSCFLAPELLRAEPDDAAQQLQNRRVLTVATQTVKPYSTFQQKRSYLGLVEPRRTSQLGFELSGKLSELLAAEGETVEQGQVLASLDSERLHAAKDEAEAQLDEAEATLMLARATLKRTIQAQKLNAISNQQLDEAKAAVKQQQAGLARVRAQLERINVDLRKSTLTAPYSGSIAARFNDEGTVLAAGTPLYELQETGAREIRIGVARSQLSRLQPGTNLTAYVDGRSLVVTIARILPGRQRLTRVVEVIAVPQNRAHFLREGDLIEIILTEQRRQAGFWLPISALTENGRGLWSCFVAAPLPATNGTTGAEHRLVRRDLEILSLEKDRAYVAGNLSVSDQVVVDGLHRIVAGQQVYIIAAQSSTGSEQPDQRH